ncbi:MAG TPA: UvrB/UvrC motif-containing protein, partial [Bacillota bacterium]|nr:UvrB/UvrC motif-containing protein [Bacillota bacterium]
EAYNRTKGITPKTIEKAVRAVIEATKQGQDIEYKGKSPVELTKKELKEYVKIMEKEMKQAAADLQFERAAKLRDEIFEYKTRL